jgi:hypothetical protein
LTRDLINFTLSIKRQRLKSIYDTNTDQDCRTCEGRGLISIPSRTNQFKVIPEKCKDCNGLGRFESEPIEQMFPEPNDSTNVDIVGPLYGNNFKDYIFRTFPALGVNVVETFDLHEPNKICLKIGLATEVFSFDDKSISIRDIQKIGDLLDHDPNSTMTFRVCEVELCKTRKGESKCEQRLCSCTTFNVFRLAWKQKLTNS